MFKFIISRDVFGLTSALTFCHEHLRDLFILCPSKTSLENGNFKWKFKHFCRSLQPKVCAYRLYKGDRKDVAFLSWKTTYPLKWLRLNLCWCCHSLWSQRLHIAAILCNVEYCPPGDIRDQQSSLSRAPPKPEAAVTKGSTVCSPTSPLSLLLPSSENQR